jgi:ribonuclease P protein component
VPEQKKNFALSTRRLHKIDYSNIFSASTIKCHQNCLMLLAQNSTKSYLRLGIIIAKKNISSAVIRNRYKRIIRDYIRLHCSDIPLNTVILVKKHPQILENHQLKKQLNDLFDRMQRKYPDIKNTYN